jgi:hypothetical protein
VLAPNFGYSTEFDYESWHGGLRVDRSLAQDNFILSFTYSAFLDRVHPFRPSTSAFASWQDKNSHTFALSVSQILSKSDLVLLGYDFTRQDGFLGGTQNSIEVSGSRVDESLPPFRNRHATTLRYVHGFNDALSGHMDYRFYFDDWGIQAHSVEPALYWAFAEDDGLVKAYYRFHTQSSADYYSGAFSRRRIYMTSDSDLEGLAVNEGGFMASWKWHPKAGFFESLGLMGATIFYGRTNDLNAGILQAGFTGDIR